MKKPTGTPSMISPKQRRNKTTSQLKHWKSNRCPKCSSRALVVDSRVDRSRIFTFDCHATRRKYQCQSCENSYSTVELPVEEIYILREQGYKRAYGKLVARSLSKAPSAPKKDDNIPPWLKRIQEKLNKS